MVVDIVMMVIKHMRRGRKTATRGKDFGKVNDLLIAETNDIETKKMRENAISRLRRGSGTGKPPKD
jgi:hypothetical protein